MTTLGTAYFVEDRRVAVETGHVRGRYGDQEFELRDGEAFDPERKGEPSPRAFFTRLDMSAKILTPTTIEIVLKNEMPDAITLAPPTSGEPFFFAGLNGRDKPLESVDESGAISLAPGAERRFSVTLPFSVPGDRTLYVSCPSLKTRVRRAGEPARHQ